MSMQTQILGIIFLYCAIFAWMSVPFVTTDKVMLRKQIIFIENLEEQIVADHAVMADNTAITPAYP